MCFRHDGPEGLPVRGSDHEEAPPPQADPAVRRVHQRGAHLHHHRAHEERQPARVPPGTNNILLPANL